MPVISGSMLDHRDSVRRDAALVRAARRLPEATA